MFSASAVIWVFYLWYVEAVDLSFPLTGWISIVPANGRSIHLFLPKRFTGLWGAENLSVYWVQYFCVCCKRFCWYFRSSVSDLRIEYKSVLIASIWSEERLPFFPHLLGSVYTFARWYQGWVLQQTQDDTESKWLMPVASFMYSIGLYCSGFEILMGWLSSVMWQHVIWYIGHCFKGMCCYYLQGRCLILKMASICSSKIWYQLTKL